MDVSTRRLIIQRAARFFDSGVVPQSWEALTLQQRLEIEHHDPELAAVWQDKMPAALEEQVLSGKWSAEPPAVRDLAAEREAAINEYFASRPAPKSAEELEREVQERIAEQEQARRNSAVMAYGRWQ